MQKQQFSSYTPTKNGTRSIEEAISELQREMDTRKRIFDNWVGSGRVSWVDAHDRMERLLSALRLLIQYSNELDAAERESNNTHPFVAEEQAGNTLDTPATQAAA